ncbi:MAG: hypothetical protein R3C14_19280 [Caldilineaceae bacterium]
MLNRLRCISLALLTGFIALTAIGGGIALLIGLEDRRFPVEWLRGTPFPNYTIPALILAIAVGSSALLACVLLLRRHRRRFLASVVAGVIMMGYIVVETLILQQEPPGPTSIEMFYFGLGALIVVLAGYRWQNSPRLHAPSK